MSDRTIDEATPDTQVTGVENIPVSDGGSPKCVTVTQVKDFVLGKIGTIANVSTPTLATDGVYIKRSSEIKPISASDLADAIIAFAFGKAEVSTLTTEATIVIKSGNDIKTTDINELAEVVKDAIELDAFNIAGLTATTTVTDANSVAIDESGTTKKVTSAIYASYVIGKIAAAITESTSALADADYIICANGDAMKKVKVSNAGFGKGNVIGPSANTDGKIPQWDGANSKTLKDGLTVASSVTSASASTEIPTAAAVHAAITSAVAASGDVTGPSSSTDGKVALFDGTTGKTIKVGGAVKSEISANPTATDIASEKAVSDAIAAAVSAAVADKAVVPDTRTAGKIPTWEGGTSKELEDGYGVVTQIAETSAQASDSKIPTEKAVYTMNAATAAAATAAATTAGNAIPKASSSVDGRLVQWDGTGGDKVKSSGMQVVTAISGTPVDTAVPTEKAVSEGIGGAITASVGTGGAVKNAIGSEITTSCATNGTIRTAIDGRITASVGTGGTVKTAIGTEISSACATGGTIDSAIDTKVAAATSLGNVRGPSTSTNESIAVYQGTTGKLIKVGPSVSTAIDTSAPSISSVPTDKAVRDCIDAKITSACAANGAVQNLISQKKQDGDLGDTISEDLNDWANYPQTMIPVCHKVINQGANQKRIHGKGVYVQTTTGSTNTNISYLDGDGTTEDRTVPTLKKVQGMISDYEPVLPVISSVNLPEPELSNVGKAYLVFDETSGETVTQYLAICNAAGEGGFHWFGIQLNALDF